MKKIYVKLHSNKNANYIKNLYLELDEKWQLNHIEKNFWNCIKKNY